MGSFALRSHYWGSLIMIVVSGDVADGDAVELGSQLRRLQRENHVVVDLWDVTALDAAAIGALVAAKRQADAARWGFAVVIDPDGPCGEAIEQAGATTALKPYRSRHAARAALQHA